jgi:hypothetical protein
MSIATFSPATTTTHRRRLSLPFAGLFSFVKKIFTKPRRLFLTLITLGVLVGLYFIFVAEDNDAARANLPLAHNYEVVAKTKDGKNTNGKLPIEVTGAQKAEWVLVQGQRVTARNNKEFLVLNMEISNNYNVALYTYPVDSFRLIDSDNKKFAPTAHQGNVEIRPQSTKTSNVGFIVPKGTDRFKVEVGELNGEKTVLEFTLK